MSILLMQLVSKKNTNKFSWKAACGVLQNIYKKTQIKKNINFKIKTELVGITIVKHYVQKKNINKQEWVGKKIE